ncbi:hypothetical protein KR044_011936, partial [Drosophila immigrans]
MKSIVVLCSLLLGLILLSCETHAADCDVAKNPDDSDFTNFFKNIGCKVSAGAEHVVIAAKPYAEAIGEGAKDLGNTVAQKYGEFKHRLSTDDASTPKTPVAYDAPTERVPLAPIAPAIPAE